MFQYFIHSANAQVVPTWPATSTTAIVDATSDQLVTSLTYVISTIAPYAIAVLAFVLVVGFFVMLMRRKGRA